MNACLSVFPVSELLQLLVRDPLPAVHLPQHPEVWARLEQQLDGPEGDLEAAQDADLLDVAEGALGGETRNSFKVLPRIACPAILQYTLLPKQEKIALPKRKVLYRGQ